MFESLDRLIGVKSPVKKLGAVVGPTRVRVTGQIDCSNLVKSPISGLAAAAFRVQVGYGYMRRIGRGDRERTVPEFQPAYGETPADGLAVVVGARRIEVSPQNLTLGRGTDIGTPIGTATIPPHYEAALVEAPSPTEKYGSRASDVALSFREHSLSRGEHVVLEAIVVPRDDGVLETRPDYGTASIVEADVNPLVAEQRRKGMLVALLFVLVVLVEIFVQLAGKKFAWW